MLVKDKNVVVTGGAHGIGRALVRRFAADGARGVVIADLDAEGSTRLADEVGGLAVPTDVSEEASVRALVKAAEDAYGPVDLFCSNAGIAVGGGVEAPDADWERLWRVHVLAHVFAVRAVLPSMLERGEGYLLSTASAAGVLNQIGSAPYGVTKHAAVGLAEWLAITYGDQGIGVSVLCPQAVRTAMTTGPETEEMGAHAAHIDGMLEPDQVAECVSQALAEERFLILPHAEVLTYMRRKTEDYERWISGMQRLQKKLGFVPPTP